MRLQWTSKALADLDRLHKFFANDNPKAAAKLVQALVAAPNELLVHPRIGEQVDQYRPREVRRLLVGLYELRYEIAEQTIFVLRIWHTREDR